MRNALRLLSLAATAAFVTACSDSSAPSGTTTLSTEQRVALSTALADVYDGTTGIASAASKVVMLANAIGRLDAGTAAAGAAIDASVHGVRATSYVGAVGFQIIEDDGGGSFYTNTAVVGWEGLRIQSKTVDELVFAGAITSTVTPAGTGSYAMNAATEPQGLGLYASQVNTSTYFATTGAFTLTATSFSGALLDCSEPGFNCSYRIGSMSGGFSFTATRIDGGGPTAYTQPPVSFTNLPAVQVLVTPAAN